MSFRGLAELGVNLIGKDNVSRILHKIGKNSENTESRLSKMGKNAALAFKGLALAAGAAAIKIGVDGVKSAIEDEKSQALLAKSLQNTTHATNAQIKSVEKYISKTQLRYGKSDNELRASMQKLVTATHSVTKAQELQQVALDVSASTGKDLETVSLALGKAYNGNLGALTRLGVPLSDNIKKTKDAKGAIDELSKAYGGSADKAAGTFQGRLDRMNQQWNEMKEQIGYILLEGLQPLMDWASGPEGQAFLKDFMNAFKDAAVAVVKALPIILQGLKGIGKIAGGLGLNFKDFLTPELLLAAGAFVSTPGPIQVKAVAAIAAYAAASGYQTKQDLKSRPGTMMIPGGAALNVAGSYTTGVAFSGIYVTPGAGGGKIPKPSKDEQKNKANWFKKLSPMQQQVANWVALGSYNPRGNDWSAFPKGFVKVKDTYSTWKFDPKRKYAKGGIFTGPRIGMIGEAGPEAVIPLNKAGGLGMTVNIHVAGSVVHERDLAVMVRDNIGQLMRRRGLNPSILGV